MCVCAVVLFCVDLLWFMYVCCCDGVSVLCCFVFVVRLCCGGWRVLIRVLRFVVVCVLCCVV